MKRLPLFFPLCLVSCILCFSQCKNRVVKTQSISTQSEIYNSENTEILFSEFITLYNELISFKNNPDFIKDGFIVGGPYNEWLSKVEKLIKDDSLNLLASKKVLAGELQQLGLLYSSSQGKETDATIYLNESFDKAINPVAVISPEILSQKYDTIRQTCDLVGKWRIVFKGMNIDYIYEIYKEGDKFIGIAHKKKLEFEPLDKIGNKYIIKGNKAGEYYLIHNNMDMSLWDNSGTLM